MYWNLYPWATHHACVSCPHRPQQHALDLVIFSPIVLESLAVPHFTNSSSAHGKNMDLGGRGFLVKAILTPCNSVTWFGRKFPRRPPHSMRGGILFLPWHAAEFRVLWNLLGRLFTLSWLFAFGSVTGCCLFLFFLLLSPPFSSSFFSSSSHAELKKLLCWFLVGY